MNIYDLLRFPTEAIRETIPVLDSEELVNKAYEGLLAVLALYPKGEGLSVYSLNHERGNKDLDFFDPLVSGLYIPGSKRLYWCGHVDVSVDPIPDRGSVYIAPPADSEYAYVSVIRMDAFPKRIFSGSHRIKHRFKVITVVFYKKQFHREKGPVGKFTSYFSIGEDGSIYQAVDTRFVAIPLNSQYIFGPGAISLLADRQFIWNIETREPTGYGIPAIVNFGIEEDLVKSLAYARSLPATESGRKRPILHWVRAHKRRIKDGIDIDIEKFLRGITEFEMDGLNFKITRPLKSKQV